MEKLYFELLLEYQQFVQSIREQEKKGVTGKALLELDKQKNNLHKKLKQEGSLLGKTDAEIFADILQREKNLADYGLPEFNVISREGLQGDATSSRDLTAQDLTLHEISYEKEKTKMGVGDLLPGEVAIVFGREVAVAVRFPDTDIVTTRGNLISMDNKETREQIRRAFRFALQYNLKLLVDYTFTHEYTEKVYGVVVQRDDFEYLVGKIRQNKQKYGIQESDMDPEIINQDWKEYTKKIEKYLTENGEMPLEMVRFLYNYVWDRVNTPGSLFKTEEQLLQECIRHGWTKESQTPSPNEHFEGDKEILEGFLTHQVEFYDQEKIVDDESVKDPEEERERKKIGELPLYQQIDAWLKGK